MMFERLLLTGIEHPTLRDLIEDVSRAQRAVLQAVEDAV